MIRSANSPVTVSSSQYHTQRKECMLRSAHRLRLAQTEAVSVVCGWPTRAAVRQTGLWQLQQHAASRVTAVLVHLLGAVLISGFTGRAACVICAGAGILAVCRDHPAQSQLLDELIKVLMQWAQTFCAQFRIMVRLELQSGNLPMSNVCRACH